MLTQIINGRILTPQGWLKDGSVLICDGKILEVTNSDLAVIGSTMFQMCSSCRAECFFRCFRIIMSATSICMHTYKSGHNRHPSGINNRCTDNR